MRFFRRSKRSKRRQELAEPLLALAGALTSTESYEHRMRRVCREVCTLLECDRSSVFLRRGRRYRAAFNYGNPPNVAQAFHRHRVRLDDPLVSLAVERQGCVLVNDAPSSPLVDARTARAAGIRAIIVAPLLDDSSEAIGFMTAEFNESTRSFQQLDATLLAGIAKLVSADCVRERLARTRTEVEYERRERVEGLKRLSGGLAHELNNSLTAVIGNGELLMTRDDIPEAARGMLQTMVESAEDAAGLVREMLVFAQRHPDKPEALRLESLVREMLPAVRRLIPENVEVRDDIGSALGFVHVDRGMMRQVVLRLVLNACDVMQGGGRLSISVDAAELRSGAPTEGHAQPAVRLEVRDTGDGIAPSSMGRVFEPFGRPSPRGASTGMGLAFVHGAVQRAGGFVDVESEPDVGTAVRVLLPALRATEGRAEQHDTPIPKVRPAIPIPAHVLVVDDSPMVRRVARDALELQGYTVREAASAAEAIEWASGEGTELDLLLSDVVMPGKSGPELAIQLRRSRPDLLVLFMSGHADDLVLRNGIPPEDRALLNKPFTPDELADRVAQTLARRRAR